MPPLTSRRGANQKLADNGAPVLAMQCIDVGSSSPQGGLVAFLWSTNLTTIWDTVSRLIKEAKLGKSDVLGSLRNVIYIYYIYIQSLVPRPPINRIVTIYESYKTHWKPVTRVVYGVHQKATFDTELSSCWRLEIPWGRFCKQVGALRWLFQGIILHRIV